MRNLAPVFLLTLLAGGCASVATSPQQPANDGAMPDTGTPRPATPPALPAPPRPAAPAPGQIPSVTEPMSAASRALLDQSLAQARAGSYGQAAATLERAIRIEPSQPALWLELGQIRYLEGNYAQAEQLGRKAVSLTQPGSTTTPRARQLIENALQAQGR